MEEENKLVYIVAYLFALLSGIIVYLIAGQNKRLKFHARQAIVLGIIIFVIGFIPIVSLLTIVIWIYGVYIGVQAYYGKNISVPFMSKFEEKPAKTHGKAKRTSSSSEDNDALKALKLRYASGKITKKQYMKMKKDIEA